MSKQNQLYQLIVKRRTIRLFKQRRVALSLIKKAVNAGRLAPSASNLQFLEYLVVTKKELCCQVFSNTRWAGYIKPRRTPQPGQQPTCYIVILINKEKSPQPDARDVGAAAENILLALLSFGIGACWIGALDRPKLRRILKIPPRFQIDSLLACGYPLEAPLLEEEACEVKYWLDKKNRLHVPKRPLPDILHLKA